MNCRPNDLARVIAPGRLARCPSCGGTALTVKPDTLVVVTEHDGIAWKLAEPIFGEIQFDCGTYLAFRCRMLFDDILRPIRDPGDDAIDETLVPGYVKPTEQVTA